MQDPLRLKQLLINLLSNAFKYTPAGRVRLHASVQGEGKAEANANAHRQLRLEVADTGPGIDPAMQARLFTPFADDDSASRPRPSEGSSGLGLVICRDLAAQMGGHLELSSEPGHGTRATLLLPLLECAAEPVAAPRAGVVLVCDDDITSRLLLAQLLRHAGYTVEETASGAEVLARCARGGVAAVITDLHMPGMDGAELLRRLRSAAPAAWRRRRCWCCARATSACRTRLPLRQADTVAVEAAEAAGAREPGRRPPGQARGPAGPAAGAAPGRRAPPDPTDCRIEPTDAGPDCLKCAANSSRWTPCSRPPAWPPAAAWPRPWWPTARCR
jgi:CheY-like chemotaxis protein/anti-sigma regulatory factor (Ser/Thr protein kinase)